MAGKHKPAAITALLRANDLSLDAATTLKALERAGVISEQKYVSTSGSGEIKSFRKIVEAQLRYGINAPTPHPFRTEPKFYREHFPGLVALVADQIKKEAENL